MPIVPKTPQPFTMHLQTTTSDTETPSATDYNKGFYPRISYREWRLRHCLSRAILIASNLKWVHAPTQAPLLFCAQRNATDEIHGRRETQRDLHREVCFVGFDKPWYNKVPQFVRESKQVLPSYGLLPAWLSSRFFGALKNSGFTTRPAHCWRNYSRLGVYAQYGRHT
jgi:hypothetical protein